MIALYPGDYDGIADIIMKYYRISGGKFILFKFGSRYTHIVVSLFFEQRQVVPGSNTCIKGYNGFYVPGVVGVALQGCNDSGKGSAICSIATEKPAVFYKTFLIGYKGQHDQFQKLRPRKKLRCYQFVNNFQI